MKSLIVSALFICGTLSAQEAPSQRIAAPIAPRNIQVLIEKDASEALLEVKGVTSKDIEQIKKFAKSIDK